MFEFEKFIVYQKSLDFYSLIRKIKFTKSLSDKILADQLLRSTTSVYLNISEGLGRSSKKDKRHFFVISRGSLYESIAIVNLLVRDGLINENEFEKLYSTGTEISKMLYALIRKMDQ